MKKSLLAFSAVGAVLIGAAFTFQSGSSRLQAWSTALTKAGGASGTVTAQAVGGARVSTQFAVGSNLKLRVENPTTLFVSNGTELVTYVKGIKQYFRKPMTAADATRILSDDSLRMFMPLVNASEMSKFSSATVKGQINRRGVSLDQVHFGWNSAQGKTAVASIGTDDNVLRQLEITSNSGSKPTTTIYGYDSLTLGAPSDATFTFTAPPGAKEVKESDLTEIKWFERLADAKAVAVAQNKMIFLDFYFDGCPPCEMMAANVFSTDAFKEKAKNFVFCKIDIIDHPEENAPFGVNAVPHIKFMRPDGSVTNQIEGYHDLPQTLAEMDKALASK